MFAWALATIALAAPGGAHATVDPTRLGPVVPRSFLGLSIEWDSVSAYARRAAALQRLLAPIAREQGGLGLRIGGDTEDQAWWNPGRRRTRPQKVLQDVTARTLDEVGELSRAVGGGPVTLGVNLALRDPRNARALVDAARTRLRVDTIEIGNEPDLYTSARTFRIPGHTHRRLRKHVRYSPAAYARDVSAYLHVLRNPRLAVAGFAQASWWRFLPGLLNRWGRRANVLGVHMYAVPYCKLPAPPAEWLATAEASRGLARRIYPIQQLAVRRHRILRVTELNSAVCGGRRGLSNTRAAAVWLADILFSLVAHGVQQADVHTWNHAIYAPFAPDGRRMLARPPLRGLEAFAAAAPAGSRLAAVRVSGPIRAWATRDRAGVVRVLLLAPRAVRVHLTVPHRAGPHAVTLRARSVRVLSYRR